MDGILRSFLSLLGRFLPAPVPVVLPAVSIGLVWRKVLLRCSLVWVISLLVTLLWSTIKALACIVLVELIWIRLLIELVSIGRVVLLLVYLSILLVVLWLLLGWHLPELLHLNILCCSSLIIWVHVLLVPKWLCLGRGVGLLLGARRRRRAALRPLHPRHAVRYHRLHNIREGSAHIC